MNDELREAGPRGSRRRVLAGAGTVLAAALPGCWGGDSQSDDGDGSGGDDGAGSEGTDDGDVAAAPSETATVAARTDGEGTRFDPQVAWVEVGGSVSWEVESGSHSVTAYHPDNDDPRRVPEGAEAFDSGRLEEGERFEWTFETEGVHGYYCEPHRGVGMVGAVVVGDPDPDPEVEPGLADPGDEIASPEDVGALVDRVVDVLEGSAPLDDGDPDATVGASVSVTDGSFQPDLVFVDAGEAVRWTWADDGHTVTAYDDRIPDGAESFDSDYRDAGETFVHTFDAEGVYDYYCQPHEGSGMVGSVVVGSPEPDPDAEPGLAEPGDGVGAPDAISSLNDRATEALSASSQEAPIRAAVDVADGEFAPDVVSVDVGEAVQWSWSEDGHTVTSYDGRVPPGPEPFDSGYGSAGDTFVRTFETEGVYDYYCEPHRSGGMVGSVVVGEPDPETSIQPALSEPEATGAEGDALRDLNQRVRELLGAGEDGGGGETGEVTAVVDIPGREFDADLVEVAVGEAVRWTWSDDAHTATAYDDRIPEGAATFDSGFQNAGEEFVHTFDSEGVYDYYCQPHEGNGMVGSVVVGSPEPDPASEPGLAEPGDDADAADALRDLNDRAVELLGGQAGDGEQGGDGQQGGDGSVTAEVTVADGRFEPDLAEVGVGEAVEWTWADGGHTVTAYDDRVPEGAATFDSGFADSGETVQHVFETEGVYDYYCQPHRDDGMVASVIVGDPDPAGQPGLSAPSVGDEEGSALSSLNSRAEERLTGSGDDGSGDDGTGDDGSGADDVVQASDHRDSDQDLTIDAPQSVSPGESVTVVVRLGGSRVAGALVETDDAEVRTDDEGEATVTVPDLDSDDEFRIDAEVPDGDPDGRVEIPVE